MAQSCCHPGESRGPEDSAVKKKSEKHLDSGLRRKDSLEDLIIHKNRVFSCYIVQPLKSLNKQN